MNEKTNTSDISKVPYDLLGLRQILDPIEKYGGEDHIRNLYASSCESLNVEFYCDIQKKRTIQRQYIDFLQTQLKLISTTSINETTSDASSIFSYLDKHAMQIEKMKQNIPCNLVIKQSDVEMIYEEQCLDRYLPTHFYNLDKLTNGFGKGHLIILGARSSMGKSAFAVNLVLNMSMAKKKILMINLEMTNQEIISRLMVLNSNMRESDMKKEDFNRSFDVIRNLPIFYMQNQNKMMESHFSVILETIYSTMNHQQVDMVLIDYMQLLYLFQTRENRNLELEKMTSKLKSIALQYKIPIVCISQLNRLVESRTCRRPMMSDLKDSGSIEQCADLVLLLYRDDYYNPEKNKGIVECIVAKNRHGNTGTVKFRFQKYNARFEEVI